MKRFPSGLKKKNFVTQISDFKVLGLHLLNVFLVAQRILLPRGFSGVLFLYLEELLKGLLSRLNHLS